MRILFQNIALTCIFLVLLPLNAKAQESPQGRVSITGSPKITQLVEKHKEISKIHPEFEGFRVQIFFDSGNNSKSKAYDVYKNFLAKYSGHEAYVSFQEPNYKVRVGDFRTRIEAEGFLQQLLQDYPSAFVIKDNILFPPLETPENLSDQ